jgi:multidrug efflux system membrane fusion protein
MNQKPKEVWRMNSVNSISTDHLQRKSYRACVAMILIAAVLALLLTACAKEEEKAAVEVIRPVKMMTISSGGKAFKRAFPGKVQASQEVDLAFKVSGPLITLPVKEGQKVNKGVLLARIDPRDYKTKLATITSSTAEARAKLKAMKIGARPEDLEVLEAEVAAAKAYFVNAKKQYKRYQELYIRNQVSKAEFDQYKSNRDVARAQLNTAVQNLKKGKTGARKEDIDAMESNIKGLESQQKAARDALGDTYLKAPFGGVIAKKYVDNFQEVQAKQAIVSLQDVSSIDIHINVPESIMALARGKKKGATAMAEFSTAPGKQYKLSVKEFSTRADPQTQTFQVTLLMKQPEDVNILPGMTANVVLTGASMEGVGDQIVIPAIAVFSDESGTPHVWVVDPKTSQTQRRKVATGSLTGKESIRITDGLKPGETIAVAGVTQLREGMKVREMDK